MKKLIRLITTIMAVVSFGACNYDKSSQVTPTVKDNVSFSLDIQPILNMECKGCHNPADTKPDLREGFAYKSLMSVEGRIVPGDAEGSDLGQMLGGGGDNPMPPGGSITPTKVALIKKWIDEGALNN